MSFKQSEIDAEEGAQNPQQGDMCLDEPLHSTAEQYDVEMHKGMLGFELLSTPSQLHCIFSVDQTVGQVGVHKNHPTPHHQTLFLMSRLPWYPFVNVKAFPKGVCVGDLLVGLNGMNLQKSSHRKVLHALQNQPRPFKLTLQKYNDRKSNERGTDIGKWILATKAAGIRSAGYARRALYIP
jgi:hypothetical protein